MASIYLLTVAPKIDVETSIDELIDLDSKYAKSVLISTKQYRHAAVSHHEDLTVASLNESLGFCFEDNAEIIVIQHRPTLISYVNVYRFLRANNVSCFSIKCAGSELIETSVDRVFDHFARSASEDNSDTVIWVEPEKIKLRHEFVPAHHGAVLAGDWDLDVQDFDTSVTFSAGLIENKIHNIPWKDTTYYKDVSLSLESGESRFGCNSIADFECRLDKIDTLYKDILKHGWQQEPGSDYVSINVGRDGTLIFNDGRHRLAIAKFLKIKKIPVKIAVRHRDWAVFKNEIKSYAQVHYGGKVYNLLEHPDLQEFECTQHDDRLSFMISKLPVEAKTVLDIGSHWGFFCGELEKLGYHCTAVEGDIQNYYFLEKLRVANGHKFEVINQSIFDFLESPKHFDLVLALNIFHHFLKSEELFNKFKKMLNALSMKTMLLQTHSPAEPQMQGSYVNFSGYQFAEFIVNNSCLKNVELIHEYPNGRVIFKISE